MPPVGSDQHSGRGFIAVDRLANGRDAWDAPAPLDGAARNAFAAALSAYFALVVPNDLAVLLVGSAIALVFASYAPLFGVLAVGRLAG